MMRTPRMSARRNLVLLHSGDDPPRSPKPAAPGPLIRIPSTDPGVVRLIEAVGLRDACDLDLLLFFSRHPRVVLSCEQLAAYVGYDLAQVARTLDHLLGAGLLKRALDCGAPGRTYVIEIDHVEEWREPLRRVCATPDGRHALRALLRHRQQA